LSNVGQGVERVRLRNDNRTSWAETETV